MTRRATSPATPWPARRRIATCSTSGRKARTARSLTSRRSSLTFDQFAPASPVALAKRAFTFVSADALQRRKRLDQPAVELREHAGEEGYPGQHQQAAHQPFHVDEMGTKARKEGRKRLDRQRRD